MIGFDCTLARPGFIFDAAFTAGPGLTALWGPSGAGKSTAIALIAGLVRPDRGRVTVAGETLLDTARRVRVPAHRRRVGVVFQDAALLPHLSVTANLHYGRAFTTKAERRIAPEPVIDMLGLGRLLKRSVHGLSGGERQRVAIGRALLQSPRLLLMDEPLASLDAARKAEIAPFIERVRDELAVPILYVSHASDEVRRLATQVVRFAEGRVVEVGSPDEVLGA